MSERAEALLPSVDTASEVRNFYDRYPYPPPIDSLEKYRRHWQDRERTQADFHLFWPHRAYCEDQSILIAGCGTSQAAKYAMRWPHAQVTGIDISATSVKHTNDLKKSYNLRNLDVHQLALERAGDMGMTFDLIVCTGVLHHLEDPDAGLRALGDVLKPDGVMQIMVYAPYGRAGVYMLQELCRRIELTATDGHIQDLIEMLRSLPDGHPLQNLLVQAPDFRSKAALADALLHPRDRAFSVPQLFEFVGRGGLTFGRWVRQAPYSIRCGVAAKMPQAHRVERLSIAEQYAAIELFRGTMLRHSLTVYPNDSEALKKQVGFVGDAWLSYVPIRRAETVCIQDRLPPGAAAVLINTAHTYKDLLLLLDSLEKVWFDAIDGVRTIREIVEGSPPLAHKTDHIEAARAFFERLWWYDQVVFCSFRSNAA